MEIYASYLKSLEGYSEAKIDLPKLIEGHNKIKIDSP